jgi:hypothetical protein
MTDPKYKAFSALDSFLDIVQQSLAGQVRGSHNFDAIAENAVFPICFAWNAHDAFGKKCHGASSRTAGAISSNSP